MSTACADAVRSHSCARLAGGRAGLKLTAFSFGGTAFSTDSGARQTSARPVTRERAANHGSGLRECRRPLPPACTCSPLTAVLRSTRLCRALPARPPAPPPSAARSPPLSSPPPAFFRRIRALLDAAAAAAGRCEAAWRFKAATQAAVAAPLLGGYHRAARAGHPRCSGGSGDASRLIDASLPPLMALQKSRQTSAHFFLDCASACGVRVCSWKELTSGFPTV